MKTIGSKKKRKIQEPKPIGRFCFGGCRNMFVRLFDEPCWSCSKDYHSQPIKPRKPLHYTGGAF